MRFLAMTGLVGMLAWSSATLLHGGDQAANEPAVLSVRGARAARTERMKPVFAEPASPLNIGVPAILPGGVVLVSDERLTPQQLEAPLDWPSDIAEETPAAGAGTHSEPMPGRFEPEPTLSVVQPIDESATNRSILRSAPGGADVPQPLDNELRLARRATNSQNITAPPMQQWRSPISEAPAGAGSLDDFTEPPSAPLSHDASGEPQEAEMSAMTHDAEGGGFLPSSPLSAPAPQSEPATEDNAVEPSQELASDDSDFAFANDTPAAGQGGAPPVVDADEASPQEGEGESTADHVESGFAPIGGAADSEAAGNDVSCRWVVPEQLNLGEQATCRMIVSNAGSSVAHAVLVRIELPKNVRLANADPAPNAAGQAMTWKIARLEPGQHHEVLLTVVPTAEGNVTPTATVTCTRLAQASIAIRKPHLEVKVDGGERLSLGQPATYQLIVHNTGSGAAANVQLAARFSEGLHHPQGQEVRYRVGTLAAGETRHVQLPLTGLRPGASVIEVLVAVGDKLAAESKRNVEIVKPMLQVALSGPKLRYVDRKATYMLRVHNPGPAPADNVQVLEQLPQGLRFLEASPGGSFDPNLKQVAWFVGRLEPQQTAEVGVHVVAEEAGDHTLAAVAKADSGVTAKAKTVTKVEGVSLVVLDVVDRDDPIEAGSETAYEIRVTNRGSEPAHQVQVAARLPESMLALKANGPTEGAVEGRQVVFEPLAELAPGQSQTFVVTVKCLQAGASRFQAFFRSQEEPKALLQEETTRIYGE